MNLINLIKWCIRKKRHTYFRDLYIHLNHSLIPGDKARIRRLQIIGMNISERYIWILNNEKWKKENEFVHISGKLWEIKFRYRVIIFSIRYTLTISFNHIMFKHQFSFGWSVSRWMVTFEYQVVCDMCDG